MSNRLRRIVAVIAATLLFSTLFSTSSMASGQIESEAGNASAVVDGLLLRPAGFLGLVLGTGLFLATAPFVLVTRPHEIGRPFEQLVVRPARFLWLDPIGGH